MILHVWTVRTLGAAVLSIVACFVSDAARACCPCPPPGKPVVNADQTVIIIWDAATRTEHFIRRASFKSEADDFGFLIPTPSQPELNESGNDAFGLLEKLTAPEIERVPRPSNNMGCGCSSGAGTAMPLPMKVLVLDEKTVAGFHAVVLETNSAAALVDWLKTNGYAFSPEVEAWARPYVEAGWKITALKVAKNDADKAKHDVAASALRMSFKTDRPLFPYREPDSKSSAETLGASQRLLRIYFLAEARYEGELTMETAWTGHVAWANKLGVEDRKKALELLKIPETTGPAQWSLTEFEDHWPYRIAPADLYFSPSADQTTVKRPPIVEYVSAHGPGDLTPYALACVAVMPLILRRVRRQK